MLNLSCYSNGLFFNANPLPPGNGVRIVLDELNVHNIRLNENQVHFKGSL